jgi:phage-related protein
MRMRLGSFEPCRPTFAASLSASWHFKVKGLEQGHEPYIKHLEGKLWEIRIIGRDNIARSIYMTASGRRVVVLHTFIKKHDKAPRRALEIARARMREVK